MSDEISPNTPAPNIPDHELIRRVGEGSYGEIWLARSVMGRYRAVKIIFRNRFTNPAPFDREFRGIQKFEPISRTHPGVIAILHAGSKPAEGYFFYVMELADDVTRGQQIDPESYVPKTLSESISNGSKLEMEKCLDLGLALAQALSHLHENGLVHRDIKPSNIIFVNNRPKLADIGLVAEIGAAKSYVGTEGYIPPEGAGSYQADIFSLGKVLYEAISGKDRQHFPALPTLLGSEIESARFFEFNEVLVKACHPSPAQRYSSAREMERDLTLLKNGGSVKRANAFKRNLARARVAAVIALAAGIVGITASSWKHKVVEEIRAEQSSLKPKGISAPEIVSQPKDLQANVGTPARFSCEARRIGKLRYQWMHDGNAIPAQTNALLTIGSVGLNDEGNYTVRVTNEGGSSESAPARLTVETARILPSSYDLWDVESGVEILKSTGFLTAGSPTGMFGGHGQNAVDEATYSYFLDEAPPAFTHFVEWKTPSIVELQAVRLFASGDGPDLNNGREFRRFTLKTQSPGSKDFDITLLNFTPSHPYELLDTGTWAILDVQLPPIKGQFFRAEFQQDDRHAHFDGPRIIELDAFSSIPQVHPGILQEPKSQRISLGQAATFSVRARGGNLHYFWKHNEAIVPGADEPKLTIANARENDAGPYSVVVSNSVAVIVSARAVLEVELAGSAR